MWSDIEDLLNPAKSICPPNASPSTILTAVFVILDANTAQMEVKDSQKNS